MKKQEIFHFSLNLLGNSTRNVVNAWKEGKQGGGECLLHLLGQAVEGVRVDRVDLVVVQRQPGHLPSIRSGLSTDSDLAKYLPPKQNWH